MEKLSALFTTNKWVQNIIVWVCVLFLIFVVMSDGEGDIVEGFITFALFGIAIYINNLLISPFYKTRKVLFFFFFFLNIVTLSVLTMFLVIDEPSIQKGLASFGNFLLAVIFGSSLKMARDNFIRNQQGKEAELQLLKAQLNPHFLFNTLNNLYGLSVIKSDKLPDLMLQLSSLLRYSLYETKDELVSFEKELNYLKDYISLEKIRLEAQTEINFSVKGEVLGKQIAPMLLIVFVENAFKHLGAHKGIKSTVSINIALKENKLLFDCENSYDSSKLQEENLEKGKSGIGLVNAKKRLTLMYPDAHKLSIQKENDFFKVALTLSI